MKPKMKPALFVAAAVLAVLIAAALLKSVGNAEPPISYSYDSGTKTFEFIASSGHSIDSVSISGEKMILLDTPSGYRAKIADARAGEMEVVTVYYTDANKKEHSNVFQITPSADQSLTVIQLDEAGRRIGSHHWVH